MKKKPQDSGSEESVELLPDAVPEVMPKALTAFEFNILCILAIPIGLAACGVGIVILGSIGRAIL